MKDEPPYLAFDSNVLTFFLDANRGRYRHAPADALADERVAAFRLFLHCTPVIMPTVTREADAIRDAAKRDEHEMFIRVAFVEFNPDDHQIQAVERRAQELLPHHPGGDNDCRILAEAEADTAISVLVTFDSDFRDRLAPQTRVDLLSPVQCWERLEIPRGTPPRSTPALGHPLANETWWRWE